MQSTMGFVTSPEPASQTGYSSPKNSRWFAGMALDWNGDRNVMNRG
jgi:hypothetical protein